MKKGIRYIWIGVGIGAGVFMILSLFLPYIVNTLWFTKPPMKFFDISIEPGDILNYYGTCLSLISTLILGIVSMYQTYRANKKTSEVDALRLSLSQREADILMNYAVKRVTSPPEFEIKLEGYTGYYSDIILDIKNCSSDVVTDFEFVSFKLFFEDDSMLKVDKHEVDFRSLSSNQEKTLKVYTPNLKDRKNFIMELVFSCYNGIGEKCFMKASTKVPTVKEMVKNYWKVQSADQ